MLLINCFVVLFTLSYASASPRTVEPSLTGNEGNDGKSENSNDDIWALLVAGSVGWINYRHQVR